MNRGRGLAAGIQNTALQIGGGLGLALVSAVIAARLPAHPSGEDYVHALKGGVVIGAVLPLLGAIVALAGLGAHESQPAESFDGDRSVAVACSGE